MPYLVVNFAYYYGKCTQYWASHFLGQISIFATNVLPIDFESMSSSNYGIIKIPFLPENINFRDAISKAYIWHRDVRLPNMAGVTFWHTNDFINLGVIDGNNIIPCDVLAAHSHFVMVESFFYFFIFFFGLYVFFFAIVSRFVSKHANKKTK